MIIEMKPINMVCLFKEKLVKIDWCIHISSSLKDSNNPTYDADDSNRLPAHIESRVAREKPCRTLFVRNVQVNYLTCKWQGMKAVLLTNNCQYTIPENEVRTMFEKFGEVKDVFNLIENRGMIFITFVSMFMLLLNLHLTRENNH